MRGWRLSALLLAGLALAQLRLLPLARAVSNAGTVQIRATHVWDDGSRKGRRSDQITFCLRWSSGSQIGALERKTVSGAADRERQTVRWTNLPALRDGKPVHYYLSTESVDGYHAELAGNAREGFTVTDHYTGERHLPEKTEPLTRDLSVVALWPEEKAHPERLRVTLLADDRDTGQTVLLSDRNGWCHTFSHLPLIRTGRAVEYTVMEEVPEGYLAIIRGDETEGYRITNRPV